MSLAESIHRHGKLYFSEDDTRTYLAPREAWYGRSDTLGESIAVLRRNFSNVLIRGAGYWVSGTWTHHPEILEEMRRMHPIGEESVRLDRTPLEDGIAVIVDERSLLYESMDHRLVWPLIFKQKSWGFSRIGAPYQLHLLDDLLEGLVPEQRMYIFLNCFYLDHLQRDRLAGQVKRDGKTLVWMPYAGLIAERPSGENILRPLADLGSGVRSELPSALLAQTVVPPRIAQVVELQSVNIVVCDQFADDPPQQLPIAGVSGTQPRSSLPLGVTHQPPGRSEGGFGMLGSKQHFERQYPRVHGDIMLVRSGDSFHQVVVLLGKLGDR